MWDGVHPVQQAGTATLPRDKNGGRGARKPTEASKSSQKSAYTVDSWLRVRLPSLSSVAINSQELSYFHEALNQFCCFSWRDWAN